MQRFSWGRFPIRKPGKPETNLEVARMFIDQLAMIQEKTRGNLSSEETTVLRNTLSNLQMAFVEAPGRRVEWNGRVETSRSRIRPGAGRLGTCERI